MRAAVAAARIDIDTPRLRGTLSLAGGRIDDLQLRDYKETLDAGSPDVRLFAPVGAEVGAKPYYAVYGWQAAGGLDPKLVPDARTVWSAPEGAKLTVDTPVTLSWDNGAGLVFHRTVAVDPDYMFTITQSVENNTGAAVRLAPYGIIARHGIPDEQRIYVLHEGLVRGADGKLEEIKYDNIPELDQVAGEGNAELIDVTQNGWIGFTDKY